MVEKRKMKARSEELHAHSVRGCPAYVKDRGKVSDHF